MSGCSPEAHRITYTGSNRPFPERKTHLKHWLMGAAILVTGLIFVNTPAGAFPAGGPPPPHAVHPGNLPRSANPLNLSPAQQQKVSALNLKYQPEAMKALQGVKTPEEARKKLAPFEKKMESEVMKILTPAQQTKFRALKADALKQEKAAAARVKAAPKQ